MPPEEPKPLPNKTEKATHMAPQQEECTLSS